jgi:hypothetical protein
MAAGRAIARVSGASGTVFTYAFTVTTNITMSIPVVGGAALYLSIVQTAPGYTISWDSMFLDYPVIPADPTINLKSMLHFVGMLGYWQFVNGTLGVHA